MEVSTVDIYVDLHSVATLRKDQKYLYKAKVSKCICQMPRICNLWSCSCLVSAVLHHFDVSCALLAGEKGQGFKMLVTLFQVETMEQRYSWCLDSLPPINIRTWGNFTRTSLFL
jgi:hypothetical protein